MKRPRILIVNDDGIHGPGLEPLIDSLRRIGDVTVVVPDSERSADSHSLTLHKPLRVQEIRRKVFILNGSPAACTRIAVLELLKGRVDLVASGINRGHNLGQDVVYSGTVAAAMEATMLGLPAFAISRGYRHRSEKQSRTQYGAAARFARRLALNILRHGLPKNVCLNVNVPDLPPTRIAGARVTRLGERIYDNKVTLSHDPSGSPYFWLMGKEVKGVASPGSDVEAMQNRCISVTPLQIDNTHVPSFPLLEKWDL